MRVPAASLVFISLCSAAASIAQGNLDSCTQQYNRAVAIADSGNTLGAITLAHSLSRDCPKFPPVWWLLGDLHVQWHNPDSATYYWEEYRKLQPADWAVLPDLVQAYQLLNDTVHREECRATLLRMYEEGKDTSLTSKAEYPRDYFRVDSFLVEVYEQLKPAGDRQVFIYFYWFSPGGHQIGNFSLGSYESDNEFARQLGQIKGDERVYHLDFSSAKSHATYGFYLHKPTYDELGTVVAEAIKGKVKPYSTSTFK